MSQIEFPYGYAGDVAVSAGTVWMAWATCETNELSLFSEVNRAWPLHPGLDATTWREYPPATMAVYVSRLSPAGEPAAPQRLAAGRSYIQGPILAATDGQEPWVVWCEQRDGGYALVAWRCGRQHTVATSPPAAAATGCGSRQRRATVRGLAGVGATGYTDVCPLRALAGRGRHPRRRPR